MSIASKLIASIVHALSVPRDRRMLRSHADLRPGRSWNVGIFVLWEILEHIYIFLDTVISIFADLKVTLNSVSRSAP